MELKTDIPKVYNLTNGQNTIVINPLASLDSGQGLALEYSGVDGALAAKIMGESYYKSECTNENRYIERFIFIVGLDYRIHPSSEEISMTVKYPPVENSVPIEPYCEYDEFLHYGLHAEAYNSSRFTMPPEVDIWVADKKRIIDGQNFLGFWRTAFIIDCGKDLPKLTEEIYKIKNQEFMSDIENALGSEVIEIGELY
ncbi:MAG: hypothetical protein ABI594_03400 [Ginsengibacter sp.]